MTKGEVACVSLKEHFDSRIESLDRRLTESENNSKDAIKIATSAQDKRIDLLNEFRGQSEDYAKKYALRETVEILSSQVSKIWGGLLVVAAVGVANLVKIFFGH